MEEIGEAWRSSGEVRATKRRPDQALSPAPPCKQPHSILSPLGTHPSLYQGPFPFYRLPSEVGVFSLDEKRCYHGDARRLRYYRPPQDAERNGGSLGWYLMEGFEDRYVRRNEDEKEGLLHLLTWIKGNSGLLTGSGKRPVDRDFVTWRGHLTKILCTPYETQEGWILAVTLFRGTLYISERETEAAYKKRKGRSQEQEKLMYSGYRFESFLCADAPDGAPRPDEVVNTNEAFCSVLLGRLASHSFLLAGEVDCKDQAAAKPSPPFCYVELKTSVHIKNPHQQRSFHRYKLLKWWCQSFLLGIPLIVAGFRDREGRIVSLQNYPTSDIPHQVRGERQSWEPVVCMNFCKAFLSHIKRVAIRDDPRVVYVFSWEPESDVTFTMESDSSNPVLPDWYVQALLSAGTVSSNRDADE